MLLSFPTVLLAFSSLILATPTSKRSSLIPRQFLNLPPGVSIDGRCGAQSTGGNVTCVGSPFGGCCSSSGYCGNSTQYCGEGLCQSGKCAKPSVPGAIYTKDGSCGPKAGGALCGDKEFGPCCSVYGFCGSDEGHCGAGFCISGACKGQAPVSGGPSLDGHCGPNFPGNKVCGGTTYGNCCSKFGFCGNGTNYCGKANCQSGACFPA